MTDRPILFSGPMVRALLDGRKTQTRRIIKPQPFTAPLALGERCVTDEEFLINVHEGRVRSVRFAKVDRLYVREHWRTESKAYDDLKPADMDADYPVIYEADADWSTNMTVGRFRQGMHMPRWASRLTLAVTDVRVQWLQEISTDDAMAEGCRAFGPQPGDPITADTAIGGPVEAYEALWDTINGAGAWDANPWVVAVSFTVHQCNVDQFAAAAASIDPVWAEKLRRGEV